ncbi:MAG: tripartite tricarboxylate transporter substrate binding protein BugD [Alphaproteobacteria bacterium]|nr:tripartite tricarboxylate transporter substrate binding protein BugD [Alphaproteobacteria bacterium]
MKKALAFAAALALMAGAASAQQYPTKPITVIVPFAAGGPTDVIARIVGESMSKTLGQQLVIENIAGAGGTTGITRGKEAANDGYTIMMGHMGTHGAAPALYPNIRYNPVTDFEPIGMAAGTPIVIVARKDFPAANLKEFADRLKAGQDKLNEANAGVGSVSHTTCTLLHVQLGTKPTRVPYTGTGPVLNDLVGGKVDYACDQIVNLVTQIQAGAIRAYAIATPTRSPALPDVPTTKEAGMPEYEVSAWNALFAPKGTPAPIVARLNDALSKALDDANSRKRLLDLGGVLPEGNERTSAWLGTFVAAEVDRWGKTIRAAR